MPDFEIGCKPILITNEWYPALSKPNVIVETSPIRRLREHTIITADGVEHEVDTLVFATGFRATDPPIHIESGVRYAVEALRTTDARGLASVEVSEGAQEAYTRRAHEMLRNSVWVTGACDSWYLDKSGEASVIWPSTARRCEQWTRRFDIENYIVVHRSSVPAARTIEPPSGGPVAAGGGYENPGEIR
ncbi:MAG TPA: hypothetical protein VMU39_06140 [Solirubrobacteraceae bacterium]|nr:hypothetical protein [Solirubrobacteraceae bacterium]